MKKIVPIASLLIVFSLAVHFPCLSQEKAGNTSLTITPAVTHALIDSLRQALHQYYVFPDTALKMADYLEAEYKAGAYNDIKDPVELAGRLRKDLQKVHHDGHLRLDYAPGMARQLSDTTNAAKRQAEDNARGLAEDRERNFSFNKVEILTGNIGYVSFNGFTGFIKESQSTFTSAFHFVANTKALIIDLRHNGGGSPRMVSQVESYFFPQKTHMNDIFDRQVNRMREFWADPADVDSLTLQMPVYILTSKVTFSGAEDFAYGMQSVKRAIVVGDTTGGGAHPVRPFNVGLGFVAGIPFARSVNPYTNTNWEGVGVRPDIPVASNEALLTAENTIFKQQIKEAKTEEEKKRVQRQLNYVVAMQSEETLDSATLAPYTGTYQGGLFFYIKDHFLYCKNAERGNGVFPLSHISGAWFVLDENVQVEFKTEGSGKATGIIMHWMNGNDSFKPRNAN